MAERAATISRPPLALPLVRLDHVWALLPLALVFYYGCSLPIIHSDFFYNLKIGQLMAQQRGFYWRDVVDFAPLNPPFYNQPWLSQLAFYAEMQLGGYPLVLFVHAAFLTAAYLMTFLLVRHWTASVRWASAATFLAFVIGMTNLSVRPQAFAFLPFSLTLLLLGHSAERGRALYLAPLATLFWVNVHGSFVLGPVLVGGFLLGALLETYRPGRPLAEVWRGTRVRRLAVVLVLTCVAMLINPYGPWVLDYWRRVPTNPILQQMNFEWRVTAADGLIGQLFFLSFVPLLALLLLVKVRPRPTEAVLLLGFALLGVTVVRNVVWWGFVEPPILAAMAVRTWPNALRSGGTRRELPLVNLALVLVLVAILGVGLPWFRAVNPLLSPEVRRYLDPTHPTAAVEYLKRSGASGRLFNRMEWGGYLEWELWPTVVPFVDARIEIHPDRVWYDYFDILGASASTPELLDRYQFDYVLLESAAFPTLDGLLTQAPGWQQVYRDRLAVVYARRR